MIKRNKIDSILQTFREFEKSVACARLHPPTAIGGWSSNSVLILRIQVITLRHATVAERATAKNQMIISYSASKGGMGEINEVKQGICLREVVQDRMKVVYV